MDSKGHISGITFLPQIIRDYWWGKALKTSLPNVTRVCILGCIIMFTLSGCKFFPERVFQRSKTAFKKDGAYVHRVKWQGEILLIIASWYTGDMNNWKAIAKANPNLNPKKIAIGDKIRIPSALLITRKSMPKSYLTEFYAKPKAKPPPPAPAPRPEPPKKKAQPENEKEPVLFGPKGYSK